MVPHMTKGTVLAVTVPIYPPTSESFFLRDFVRILNGLDRDAYLICGRLQGIESGRVHCVGIGASRFAAYGTIPTNLVRDVRDQKELVRKILATRELSSVVLFHVGEFRNLIPLLVAKLLRKKAIVYHIGGDKLLEYKLGAKTRLARYFGYPLTVLLLNMCYRAADGIVCDSELNARYARLRKFSSKLFFAPFVDIDRFRMTRPIGARSNLIGFVGRLVPKKNVRNFARSLSIVASDIQCQFIIIGDGPEVEAVRRLSQDQPSIKVIHLYRVPTEELVSWYNEMKLLVLPSYEEGFPRVVVEAMACGTPVLSTPVGGVPDYVIPGKTGFILKNLSPAGIADAIVKALRTDLEPLSSEALALVKKTLSFESEVNRTESVIARFEQKS